MPQGDFPPWHQFSGKACGKHLSFPRGVEKFLNDSFDNVLWDIMTTAANKTHDSLEPMHSTADPSLPTFHPTDLVASKCNEEYWVRVGHNQDGILLAEEAISLDIGHASTHFRLHTVLRLRRCTRRCQLSKMFMQCSQCHQGDGNATSLAFESVVP